MTPGGLALAVLRAAARGSLTHDAAGQIARAAILQGLGGADALEVLDGGPRWQRSAVELADRVLDALAGCGRWAAGPAGGGCWVLGQLQRQLKTAAAELAVEAHPEIGRA